jgi:hypothetical protein
MKHPDNPVDPPEAGKSRQKTEEGCVAPLGAFIMSPILPMVADLMGYSTE